MIAYRLEPRGGFHFGREGLAQENAKEVFPSDSLFSALLIQRNRLYRDSIANYCDLFPQDGAEDRKPPLRLSSVFPMIGDVSLFPRPLLPQQASTGVKQGKALKKIAYVSPMILRRLLEGQSLADLVGGGRLLQNKKILISNQETVPNLDKFWSTDAVPRVSIDRVHNASNIYQVARTVFAEGCGLWLMADVDDAETFGEILHVLGDSGIGGDRTSGYGAFEPQEIAVPDLPKAQGYPYAMTLSRYNPTLGEINQNVLGEGANYELIDVGGYLSANGVPGQRRQRVRMIEAGSILNTRKTVPVGRLVDVRPVLTADAPDDAPQPPDHPIYRSGIPLLVGVSERQPA
jgi:CRISPR-associated protein Csm4